LQKVFTKAICDSKEGGGKLWSTMYMNLQFPKSKDVYIPHRFRFNNKEELTFDEVCESLMTSNQNDVKQVLVVSAPGMGKSRASEEIHSRLVVALTDHVVVRVALSRALKLFEDYHDHDDETLLQKILLEFGGVKSETEIISKLSEGRVFAILDGLDEICPEYRDAVNILIQNLLNKRANILITTRPQEQPQLKMSFPGLTTLELLEFNRSDMIEMLQSRLGLSVEMCTDILNRFQENAEGFSSNPLHLKMICDTYEKNKAMLLDIYNLYSDFVEQKIVTGMEAKHIIKGTYLYKRTKNKIYSILGKCSIALLTWQQIQLSEDDVENINMSGIATVKDAQSQVNFVHRTYAEFIEVRCAMEYFVLESPEFDLLEIIYKSRQFQDAETLMKFLESGLRVAYKDTKPNEKALRNVAFLGPMLFQFFCNIGMPNAFRKLRECTEALNDQQLRNSFQESHNQDNFRKWLFTHACCSSDELAEMLSPFCAVFDKNINTLQAIEWIVTHSKTAKSLRLFLEKVPNWKQSVHGALPLGFSKEQAEFYFQEVPEAVERLKELYQAKGNTPSTTTTALEMYEQLISPFNKHELKLALDEDDSWKFMKNVRSLRESSEVHKACFDGNLDKLKELHLAGESLIKQNSCNQTPLHMAASLPGTDCLQYLLEIILGPNLMNISNARSDQEQSLVETHLNAVDFELCSPLQWAADYKSAANVDLIVRVLLGDLFIPKEAEIIKRRSDHQQKKVEFLLHSVNLIKKNPTSRSCEEQNVAAIDTLLRNLLGHLHATTENYKTQSRTVEDYMKIELLLCKPPRIALCESLNKMYGSDVSEKCIETLLVNLMGQFYVDDGQEALERSDEEQSMINRMLNASDRRGVTPLCDAIRLGLYNIFYKILLNLLGQRFVSLTADPSTLRPRNAKDQALVEDLLCPLIKGRSLMHLAVSTPKDTGIPALLVRNLLGSIFISKEGQNMTKNASQKALVERTINARDDERKTPTDLAQRFGNKDAAKILEINLRDTIVEEDLD
jgi:ankyrin repeat protein